MTDSEPFSAFSGERDPERRAICDAAQALLGGSVTGPMTVTRLAEVCGLKRWKLTHRHVDLKEAFQAAVGQTSMGRADGAAVERSLNLERERNAILRAHVTKLEGDLERYAMVVAELAADLGDARSKIEALSGVKRIGPRP